MISDHPRGGDCNIIMSWFLEEEKQVCSLKDFRAEYERKVITEWLLAYINYQSIQQYLKFSFDQYQHYHHKVYRQQMICIDIMPLESATKEELENAVEYVKTIVTDGQVKATKFVKWRLAEILYYWREVVQITIDYEVDQSNSHEIFGKKYDVKQLLKTIYACAVSLQEFIRLNNKISSHCKEVLATYATPLLLQKNPEPLRLNQTLQADEEEQDVDFSLFRNISTHSAKVEEENYDAQKYAQRVEREVKCLFHSPIYFSEGAQSDLYDYNRISHKVISAKNYFLMGLYMGLGLLILLSLVLLLILDFLKLDNDDSEIDSMTYIFPMFRGVGLLILYLWGMAWNAYGFIKYRINFKLILDYGSHYSNPYQIMKRAGFFTLIFCLMLFLYLVGLQANKNMDTHLPIEYTPFVVWIIYFAYIFFPSKLVFNPRGRTYFYSVLKNIFKSPWVKITFVLSFATDQAVSFVTSIKDFAYSACFYGSSFSVSEVSNCLNSVSLDGVIIGYIAAILPLLIRMVQCYNQAKQSSGKFLGHIQMWNFFKYMSSVVTSSMSFLASINSDYFKIPFIVSSIISTSYSYYWDLKYDWGLLEKDSKHRFLRNNLCYKNPTIYYSAIVVNLLLRYSWTLTISPYVVVLIPKSTFLPFLTGFLEIFRRCMWNFFRVEKEHVANCSSFSIVKEKPEIILKKIQSKQKDRSFSNTRSDIIEYTKVADLSYIEHLKLTMVRDLPEVEEPHIRQAQTDFEDYLAVVSLDEELRGTKLRRQIKSVKKDYFNL